MIVVIGLIVAFILIVVFSNRQTRNCRWRLVRSETCANRSKYRCAACGAEVFTTNGKPPLDCLADQTLS